MDNPRSELSFGQKSPMTKHRSKTRDKSQNIFKDSDQPVEITNFDESRKAKLKTINRKSAEFGERDLHLPNFIEPVITARSELIDQRMEGEEGLDGYGNDLDAEMKVRRRKNRLGDFQKRMEAGLGETDARISESQGNVNILKSSERRAKKKNPKSSKKSKLKESSEIKIPKSRVRNKKALEIYYQPKQTNQQKKDEKKKRMEKYTFRLKNSQTSSKKRESRRIHESENSDNHEMEVLWGEGVKEILSEKEIGYIESRDAGLRKGFSSETRRIDEGWRKSGGDPSRKGVGLKDEISDLKASIRALKRSRRGNQPGTDLGESERGQTARNFMKSGPVIPEIISETRPMFPGQRDMHENKKKHRLQMERDRLKRNKLSKERGKYSQTDGNLDIHLKGKIDFGGKDMGEKPGKFESSEAGWVQGVRDFEMSQNSHPKLKKFSKKNRQLVNLKSNAKSDNVGHRHNMSWDARGLDRLGEEESESGHQKKKSAFLTGGFSDFVNSFKLVSSKSKNETEVFRKDNPPVSGAERPILGFNQSAPRDFTKSEKRDSFHSYFNKNTDHRSFENGSQVTSPKVTNNKIIASKYEYILSQKRSRVKPQEAKTPPSKNRSRSRNVKDSQRKSPKYPGLDKQRPKNSPRNKNVYFRQSERQTDIASPFKRLEQASSEREKIKSRRQNSLSRSPNRRRSNNMELSPIRQKEADRWRSSITQREAPMKSKMKTGKTRLKREMRDLIQKKNQVLKKLKDRVPGEAVGGCVEDMVTKFKTQKKVSARDLRNTHIKFFSDFSQEEKRLIPMLYKLIDIELALQARSQACFLL